MKKFNSILAIITLLFAGFTSCSKNDDDVIGNNEEPTPTAEADYTIIYWASAGNNENSAFCDIAELILAREEGKFTDKINVVGCYDPSLKFHEALAAKDLGGTLEFELGSTKQNTDASVLTALKEVAGIEKSLELDKLPKKPGYDFVSIYDKPFRAMKSFKTNSEYDVYSDASLTKFIAKAAKEHPAKKYVLMLVGHGNGYNVVTDGNASVATRTCITSEVNKSTLSVDKLTNAIKNSGVKIQTIVYNCCNMAALENFASMKNVTDYVVASAEPTLGGYATTLFANLSQAGTTDEAMKNVCKKTIDFYKENVADKCEFEGYTSHGFYDLSMTDQLLSSVKKAATWFESAAKTNPQFMRDVVYNSVYVLSFSPENFIPGFTYEDIHSYKNSIYGYLSSGKLDAKSEDELIGILIPAMRLHDTQDNTFGTCFASIMDAALSDKLAAEANGLDLASLRSIYDEYLSTLKQMAYIRCNGSEANDVAYRFASPSVNLFSLNEQGFFAPNKVDISGPEIGDFLHVLEALISKGDKAGAFNTFISVVGNSSFALNNALATVKAMYANSDFDKATGWSKVLENISVNPMIAISPTRYDVTCK